MMSMIMTQVAFCKVKLSQWGIDCQRLQEACVTMFIFRLVFFFDFVSNRIIKDDFWLNLEKTDIIQYCQIKLSNSKPIEHVSLLK